jgi:hypothetical protein
LGVRRSVFGLQKLHQRVGRSVAAKGARVAEE